MELLENYNTRRRLPHGARFAVIGGGNVAVDAALCLLREGREVVMVCVEPEEEIPAIREELDEALRMGLKLIPSTGVRAIVQKGDGVRLELQRVRVVGEENGFKVVEPVEDAGELVVDGVVMAVGQESEGTFTGTAIGDYSTGPSTVAKAMATAKELFVKQYPTDKVEREVINPFYIAPQEGLTTLENILDAAREASRCISCGHCNGCGNCWLFCPDVAITPGEDGKPHIDTLHCKGCGICQSECPRGAITLRPKAF